jgi:hypothetical protein
MTHNIVVLLARPEGRALARKYCLEAGFELSFLEELVDAELEQIGKKRKAGLWATFDDILDRMDAEEDAITEDRA